MLVRLVPVLLVAVLQGCAYLTTYQADIGAPSTGVSFDAKQRLMVVNTPDNTKGRRICTEPSPDALSALGASLGASILGADSMTKQIAAALGETSASIGLRTTSIQLMRDAMYRGCEAYLSGGISEEQYADLQGHSQTLILGLLAIEQLTGAVQAQQVALLSNSSAGGLPNVAAEADNLVQAKKATVMQRAKSDAATAKKEAAEKLALAKQDEVDKAKASNAKADDLKKLEDELADLKGKASDAAQTATTEADLLSVQVKAEEIAQATFDMARSRVRAAVSGEARFGQSTISRGNMSDLTAEKLSQAVVKIVDSVIGVSIASQKCLEKMSDPKFSQLTLLQQQSIATLCGAVSAREAARAQPLK